MGKICKAKGIQTFLTHHAFCELTSKPCRESAGTQTEYPEKEDESPVLLEDETTSLVSLQNCDFVDRSFDKGESNI